MKENEQKESSLMLANGIEKAMNETRSYKFPDTFEKLASVLESLSEADCQIIVLKIGDQLSDEEAAKVIGISPDAVSSMYHQALMSFNKRLSDTIDAAVQQEALTQPFETGTDCLQGGPPQGAYYLLYLFLSKKDRVNLLGDLTGEYEEAFALFGKRKADIFYYKQVLTTLWPIWNGWITRIGAKLAKWGVFGSLGVWLRSYLTRK